MYPLRALVVVETFPVRLLREAPFRWSERRPKVLSVRFEIYGLVAAFVWMGLEVFKFVLGNPTVGSGPFRRGEVVLGENERAGGEVAFPWNLE